VKKRMLEERRPLCSQSTACSRSTVSARRRMSVMRSVREGISVSRRARRVVGLSVLGTEGGFAKTKPKRPLSSS
jgi:hypothetical protein